MKEIIVYRDKKTGKIETIHETTKHCTDENITKYNSNETYPNKVEKVILEDNSLELYLYEMKIFSKREFYERLKDIDNAISELSSDIDDRLCELEEAYNKEGE